MDTMFKSILLRLLIAMLRWQMGYHIIEDMNNSIDAAKEYLRKIER